MRTSIATFKGATLNVLQNLGATQKTYQFVKCIRINLSGKPDDFQSEIVRQQLKALAVLNTILQVRHGYSYSMSHEDFIKR